VVSVTNPYGRILDFLDRELYIDAYSKRIPLLCRKGRISSPFFVFELFTEMKGTFSCEHFMYEQFVA
jgi:hypothetical protein